MLPALHFTRSTRILGCFASGGLYSYLTFALAALVIAVNIVLVVEGPSAEGTRAATLRLAERLCLLGVGLPLLLLLLLCVRLRLLRLRLLQW